MTGIEFIYYAGSGIIFLLLTSNVWFITRLIKQTDKTNGSVNLLTTSVQVLTTRLDTYKDVVAKVPALETDVALLKQCLGKRRDS